MVVKLNKLSEKLDEMALSMKARRRIRRYIRTGEHQSRVYATSDAGVFEYKVVHHVKSIYFKKGVFGLKKLKSYQADL